MSTLQVNIIKNTGTDAPVFQNSSGNEIGHLAGGWTSFNGSSFGDRASFNVSSLTDHGTGNYAVHWQNDFPGSNAYAAVATCQGDGSVNGSNNVVQIHSASGGNKTSPSAGEMRVTAVHPANNVNQDVNYMSVVAFGV
jgi:hypothetical protein